MRIQSVTSSCDTIIPEGCVDESLSIQSGMVPDFIREAWPTSIEHARTVLGAGRRVKNVYLCGSGDSHHAAVSLELAFMQWAGVSARSAPAMSMSRYVLPDISTSGAEGLLIGISSSGEVARTIEAVEIAKSLHLQTLAITLNPQSTLSRTADATLSLVVPPYPEGPGLISYLSSYLLGLSVVGLLADREFDESVVPSVGACPDVLEEWIPQQIEIGQAYARKIRHPQCVFVGSGYAYGSALFGAAKVMEAAGEYVGAQDVEEWAHLEYFCNPADSPMWLLSAEGRSSSREGEILKAADAINRDVLTSVWKGSQDWSSRIREITAPLALWSGPVGYAIERANLISEVPFRGFGGGRSKKEGGGPSRIRSSQRFPRSKLI